ncbi:hypothetical protein AAHX10_26520 (plasmid) [Klebsiella pneumoniae]|nr:hypothetical protein [Klebsiella pneumoniae]
MPLRITPSVAEQEGQQTETEATGAPQKHHYTLNQQVGSITITCDNQEWKQHLRDDGISWPTIENIEKVLNAGFECVHFDRDADIVDELIAWDW